MHMRLIYADDREELGVRLSEIEAPFFAKFEVEDALCTPSPALSLFNIETYCSGQLIPDTTLSFSSARAGANPSLN